LHVVLNVVATSVSEWMTASSNFIPPAGARSYQIDLRGVITLQAAVDPKSAGSRRLREARCRVSVRQIQS
jgi:hypothetical protein